MFLKTKYLFN